MTLLYPRKNIYNDFLESTTISVMFFFTAMLEQVLTPHVS